MKKTPIILVMFVLLFPAHLLAQKHKDKANKYFQQAIELYRTQAFEQALSKLQKAEKIAPDMGKIFLLRGDIYADTKQDSLALTAYYQAVDLQPQQYGRVYGIIAQLHQQKGGYQAAKEAFEHYLNTLTHPKDSVKREEVHQAITACEFGMESMANPVPFAPYNLGKHINTQLSEYFPTPNMLHNSLWFTRRLESDSSGAQEDFFVSQTDSLNQWTPATPLSAPINTLFNEGAASLSADGTFLVFAACAMQPGTHAYGANRQGYGSCDLFYSRLQEGKWSEPQNMGSTINSSLWESQPSLSADGKSLYFIRATDRSKRNTDIYVATLLPTGEWTKAKPLSKLINTPKEEMSVMIHPNDCVLYFASKGHLGMGGADIFVSRRPNRLAPWGKPQNAGYPINTHKDENGLQVSHNGHTAFFASDREGGFGGMDIYAFELPEHMRAQAVAYLNINVIDADSQQALPAQLQIVAHQDSTQQIKMNTDAKGHLFATFLSNTTYALHIDKEGYLFYSDTIAMQSTHTVIQPYDKTIALTPIKEGARVRLNNIFFDTDASTLKAESDIELQKLLHFLHQNPSAQIRIEGHTDQRGSAAHNQTLSEARAKAVYDYLIAHKIEATRLSYKGYGFTKPMADNATPTGRAQNRRTEIVIM